MNNLITRVNNCLSHYLQTFNYPSVELQQAMAYAVLDGGKRIRPLLVYATGKVFNAPLENLDIAATAVEIIHSYSLIHDDLPAMDNADLRRGKLSCHKNFGEDMAILAGDALQTLAFDIIATHPASLSTKKRLSMVKILTKASGAFGMVGGQTLDLLNTVDKVILEKDLIQLYQLKTGALLQASVKLGLIASEVKNKFHSKALEKFAESISLAFQLQDDILDIEGSSKDIGKTVGADCGKKTYPVLVGIIAAKKKVQSLFAEAYSALQVFGIEADNLRELTRNMENRKL